jgi:molecular chaperone DnaJ
MKVEAGTQSGTVVRMRGKGMPDVNGYGKGDLYVKILVWIPRKLSRSEKEAMENMLSSSSFKPDPNRSDRELFEKESKYF